jgi:hypothetical protein
VADDISNKLALDVLPGAARVGPCTNIWT